MSDQKTRPGFVRISRVLLAYVDESGNTGDPALSGSTAYYSLGCLLVEASQWSATFDAHLTMRRALKTHFAVPVRAELKANWLINGKGSLSGITLATSQRKLIYRYHLESAARANTRAFAVLLDKAKHGGIWGEPCREMAWEALLQRLVTTANAHKQQVLVIHDEGEDDAIRKQLRKSRRFLTAGLPGGGSKRLDGTVLIEDPVARKSHESYFIQMADLIAYAAWRRHVPPGKSVAAVVPQNTWDHLGSALLKVVSPRSAIPAVVFR